MDTKGLSHEVAPPTLIGVRRTIEDRVSIDMRPEQLAMILREASVGNARRYLTLAEEMEERYAHYASQLQTRRLAIQGIDPVVEAAEAVPGKITEAVKGLVTESRFDAMIGDMLDGISKGYSAIEIMWEYQDQALRPVEYIWRDPRWFVFDRLSLKQLRLAVDRDFEGEELPLAKFLCHMPKTKAGIPLRAGLARPAAWAYLIQSFGLKDWAAFSEIYGIPFRVGRYGTNASDDDKRSLLRAVRMISNDAAAIIPQGMDIEFHKVEGQHGAAVFGGLMDYVDKQVSKLIVGQTMTSDDGASMAQAKVHNEVRIDILRADCKQLAQTINRDLIPYFVSMNFGPQAVYPQVEFPVPEPEDVELLTEAVARMVPFGLRVSQREMREKIGLSEPSDDDDLLIAPKVEPAVPVQEQAVKAEDKAKLAAHVSGCQCQACRPATSAASLSAEPGSAPTTDELDRLAADALVDWQDITDPLLGPLREVLAKATTLEEAVQLMAKARPDSGPLVEALARLTSIARGLGDVGDELPEPTGA
ncbi:DUF935 domain-containing protein [Hoeflea marina]|nr:DUF935 domain-containing protein [Hoeflea marina]